MNTLPTEKEKNWIPRKTETPVATPTKEKKKEKARAEKVTSSKRWQRKTV